MAKLTKRSAVSIKTEATQGTTAAPTATDFIFVEALDVNVVTEKLTRDPARSYLDPVPQMIGKRTAGVKFKAELKGPGITIASAASLSAMAPLSAALVACGLSGAFSTDRAIFYPTSSADSTNYQGPGKSATIVVYRDDIEHICKGAMGTFKITAEFGKIPYIEFDFKSDYTEPTDKAIPANSPNPLLPPIVQSSTLYMQGYAPIAAKFELDAGITVTERPDVNSANGLYGHIITDRQAKGSIDPEVPNSLATHNVFNRLVAGTTGALSATIGSTVGNIIDLYCPCVQYGDATYADRSGVLTFNTPLVIAAVTGNDSFRITFR